MNRFKRAFGLLLVSLFFFQCQKDLSYIGDPDAGIIITPDPIKATLQGNIVDENNQPAAGVAITVGANTAITNASGYFRIADASLDKNTSLVTADKPGYFKGYRVFSATSGTNQVVIKLIKKNLAGTINGAAGGTATLANSAKISLAANSVVMASTGAAFTGDVKVYASYIDPTANDIGEMVPGSFMANDKDGKRVMLSSFGMLAIELESATGEKLQIKTGAVATLTSPIPSAVLSNAPTTIALWYVDEATGIWKEEGTATKQGNNYVGDVKHFSFWNCDYPFEAATLSLTLHNAAKLPLVYTTVKITAATGDTGVSFAYGFTDSLGQVKGLVPANKNLRLDVLDPCGNTAFSQNIPAVKGSTNLGVITVPNNGNSLVTFTGILSDCSGQPVKNGYAIINFDNTIRYAATNTNGEFSTTFITCSGAPATSQVLGVDQTAQQQSLSSTVSVTAPVTNGGNITACGISSEQYINYTLDGIDYSITSTANDSILGGVYGQGIYISGRQKPPGTDNMYFTVENASGIGTYPVAQLVLQNYDSTVLTQPFNVTFTKFANIAGEFYEGTLSGKFTLDASTTVHNVSSSFKVRRIY